jgi:hypothetical protein
MILMGVFCLIVTGVCAAIANLLRRYTVLIFRDSDQRWIDFDV